MFEPHRSRQRDLLKFILAMKLVVLERLTAALLELHGLSFWVAVELRYTHPAKEIVDMKPLYLNSGKLVLTQMTNLKDQIERMSELVLEHNANYIRESSVLRVDDILGFRFKIAHFNPLAGRKHRELPMFLKNKHAIIHVKNRDYRCFGYAVLAVLEEFDDNAQRPHQYDSLVTVYEIQNFPYPVAIENVPGFEDKLKVNINVYSFYDDEGRARYPEYVSKKKFKKSIDLLHWQDHYAWITTFPAFMIDLVQKHTLHCCRRSLGHLVNENSLDVHKRYCQSVENIGQIVILHDSSFKI